MSLIRAIRCASAPLDHRLAVGDGQTMLRDAKAGLGSPQPPLGAHLLSCPIGAIPVAQPTAELIRLASIAHTTNGLDSNPQSTRPPPARGGRHLITLNRTCLLGDALELPAIRVEPAAKHTSAASVFRNADLSPPFAPASAVRPLPSTVAAVTSGSFQRAPRTGAAEKETGPGFAARQDAVTLNGLGRWVMRFGVGAAAHRRWGRRCC